MPILETARQLLLKTPLGPDKLLCLAATGSDALSQCYTLHLELASEDVAVDGSELLRKRVTLSLELPDGSTRSIHGMVRRFLQKTVEPRVAYYEADIVPEFWFLSLRRDCRIFQHKTALQIVEQILGDYSISFKTAGSPSPAQREYCVQYRETDLDFISRLLEEEGLYYTFDHGGAQEELVITEASGTPPDLGDFRLSAQPQLDQDVVYSADGEVVVHSSKVTLTDYNMETPNSSLLRSVDSTTAGAGEEVYDYPGGYLTGDDGSAIAKRLIEAEETDQQTLRGASSARAFQSGSRFTLTEHVRTALNGSYLLVSVSFRAQSGDFVSGGGSYSFRNEFLAIPVSRKFIPRRLHPRPVVHGSQTAVVVGTSGEEIDTDQYGRVKVQFFWDRVGTKNQDSSCWVRVASTWAGKNWGAIHIPRIGQEVLVDFLEGDPDHPIVTGSVYNEDMQPPYALPAHKTQSGIKSRSSKEGGSDNFNEIRFEDLKGSEELHVQAEKDMTLLVKNDRTTTIRNNDTREVTEGNDVHTIKKGDQTVTVEKGDQIIQVKEGDRLVGVDQGDHLVEVKQGDQTFIVSQGKQTTNVKMGDQVITVGQGNQTIDVKMGNQTTKVDMGNQEITVSMGNRTIKVNLGKISEEAMQGIELKVGANSIKIDQTGVTIQGLMIKVEGTVQTQVKGLMTQVGGDAMLQLHGGITMIG
ncbi:MAG TPA: type VI secretion system tip protein TssI/VgrG [Longimicrobiales bacterium]